MRINQLDLKHLCYVLVNGTIILAGNHPRDKQNRPLILKNNAPFISCITKINV